ncbi:unnamed protein product, partial [Closterium sp. NIES-54]
MLRTCNDDGADGWRGESVAMAGTDSETGGAGNRGFVRNVAKQDPRLLLEKLDTPTLVGPDLELGPKNRIGAYLKTLDKLSDALRFFEAHDYLGSCRFELRQGRALMDVAVGRLGEEFGEVLCGGSIIPDREYLLQSAAGKMPGEMLPSVPLLRSEAVTQLRPMAAWMLGNGYESACLSLYEQHRAAALLQCITRLSGSTAALGPDEVAALAWEERDPLLKLWVHNVLVLVGPETQLFRAIIGQNQPSSNNARARCLAGVVLPSLTLLHSFGCVVAGLCWEPQHLFPLLHVVQALLTLRPTSQGKRCGASSSSSAPPNLSIPPYLSTPLHTSPYLTIPNVVFPFRQVEKQFPGEAGQEVRRLFLLICSSLCTAVRRTISEFQLRVHFNPTQPLTTPPSPAQQPRNLPSSPSRSSSSSSTSLIPPPPLFDLSPTRESRDALNALKASPDVLPLTSYLVNFLILCLDPSLYLSTLLLVYGGEEGDEEVGVARVGVASQLLLAALKPNLERMGDALYCDEGMRAFFLLNNCAYMLHKVAEHDEPRVTEVLGQAWLNEVAKELLRHRDMYTRCIRDKVAPVLWGHQANAQAFTKQLAAFHTLLDAIQGQQSMWSIGNADARASVRDEVVSQVLQQYRDFLERH